MAAPASFGVGGGDAEEERVWYVPAIFYQIPTPRMPTWPDYVRERVMDTYLTLGGSLLLTSASAKVISHSPRLLNFLGDHFGIAFGGTLASLIGTGLLAWRSPSGSRRKKVAWVLHASVFGLALGRPLLLISNGRAVHSAATFITGSILGAFTGLAILDPRGGIMDLTESLRVGLAIQTASLFGLPLAVALKCPRLSTGLLLTFGMTSLCMRSWYIIKDTQTAIQDAEGIPLASSFDPIDGSMWIYWDTLKLFVESCFWLGVTDVVAGVVVAATSLDQV